MDREKGHLTWEQVVEGLYGFQPKKRTYSAKELERYRRRLEEYAGEKAAQRGGQTGGPGADSPAGGWYNGGTDERPNQ